MSKHPYDWNAKLVRFFISNSRLVWLLIFSIIIGGVTSLVSLKREGFPQVSPKIVLIQTTYPGASAREVEAQVTREIEAAIKDITGLKEFSSTSANSFSNVVVQLEESQDLDSAVQNIQSKIVRARSNLPSDVEDSEVSTVSTGGPAFIFGVTNNTTNITQIQNDAKELITIIDNVAGVKSAKFQNEKENRLLVTYRLNDLQANGIALATLTQILQAANANIPAGTIEDTSSTRSVVSVGVIGSKNELENVVIGVNPTTRQPVRVKDIASVTPHLGNSEPSERFGYTKDGKPIIATGSLVSVELNDDADVITTRDTILDEIDRKKESGDIANNVEIIAFSDQGESTRDQVREIIEAGIGAERNLYILGGLQLLFLAMLLFVNWRAALIAALAIPFSLGITFITLALLGIELNTIVLFSLILVLGLIVDPAIVMVEAIQRYLDINYDKRLAVLESGRRYGASLFMAVLTSFIVFVPFGVVSGIFGEIIKYIPLTVIPALIASYLVPVALLPLLSERFLRRRKETDTTLDEAENLPRISRSVMRLNGWILARPWREILVLIVAVILVGLSFSLLASGRVTIVQFSNPEDNELLSVKVVYTKGLSQVERDRSALEIEKITMENPAVKQLFYIERSQNSATLFATLKDKEERQDESRKSKQVVRDIRERIAQVPNLSDYVVSETGVGPPVSDYEIQTQLYDDDAANLEMAAKTVGEHLRTLEHVSKVDDGYTNQQVPQVRVVLDRSKVGQLGLSSAEIGQQLRALLNETKVTKFEDEDNATQVVYLVNETRPESVTELRNLPLATRAGTQLRLSDVATVEESSSVDTMQRFNGLRYVNVRARLDDPKNTFTVQQKFNDWLTNEKISELGLNDRANRGEADDIAKSFRELGIALAIAVLLTYIVLVLQFKSFSLPGIMLFTIPLSLIGVFPILWVTGSDLGFLELLGVTILVGIVENVAIFLIDYANQLVAEQGKSTREAIIQASGVRFRPILLTKLVAIAGLLPLAIESEFWRGLSLVIIAGIGLSGFFSLLVIPILYVWINGVRRRIHRNRAI